MCKIRFFSVFVLLALVASASLGAAMGRGPFQQGSAVAASSPSPPETGLQPGVKEFIANTYLAHAAEFPDPNEPVEALRLYLDGRELLRAGQGGEAVALFNSVVTSYPDCRHAHAGLAYALRQRYEQSQAESDLRAAVNEFIVADEIGMKYGKVHYAYLIAIGLGQLKDSTTLNNFFKKALADGNQPYRASLDYA